MRYILAVFTEYRVFVNVKRQWERRTENTYDEFDDLEDCKRHADMMKEHLDHEVDCVGYDIRIYELTNY